PGKNRCSISQEETTEEVYSRFPGHHPGGPQLGGIPPDASHQHFGSQIPSYVVKKKDVNEAMQDRPSMSSNSSKKSLHTSYKTRSLNQSLLVNDMEFQDSGHSHDVIVEKDKLKKKENDKLRENFVDEGDAIRHSKISKKRENCQEYPKDFKRVKTDGNDGTFHTGKSDKKEGIKKRKKMDELDGSGKNIKQTSESSHRKEKKARVLKSFDEGISIRKSKHTEDMKLKNVDTVMAATSSSSKVSASHKTKAKNQEAKGSLVESVSFSPMRILKLDKYTSPIRNNTKGVDLLTKDGRMPTKIELTLEQSQQGVSNDVLPRWENDPGKLFVAPYSLIRLARNQSLNPTSSTNLNPKGSTRRRAKQRVENSNLEEKFPLVFIMADQRTMVQLLQAPIEGYEDAIVISEITAANFELKHGLLTLVQNKQFYGHDKEDPHAHIRYFNKITATLKFPNVPNTSIKLMLFPFSLEGAARIWIEKEPPRSILTWDDLVSKFINQFFPPSKTTNLRNEITKFTQRFDETFSEAWDRFKDLLRAYPIMVF
nr:zinc finger, CW-type [Tanacetum cinerariifolium]